MGYWEDKLADMIGEDLDVAFAYQTMKLVRIRDRCVSSALGSLFSRGGHGPGHSHDRRKG